ncbi:MAG TPA: immunoglobulin domain-containing protein, partial [Methylomirabilota bacterium]|nr:immunoglobulin domain-containing protein [Methylomirabilota bacterium]
ASGPSEGSPSALVFTNQIHWGSGGSFNAVQLGGSSKIVHVFSGLDRTKRYIWHGTAARGAGYSDRWTLLEISAASWYAAHTMTSTGLFVQAQIPSLTSSQAVANFAENRLLGTYASWTDIQPNPDGTIFIYQSSYRGPLPNGLTSGGLYGYGVVADRFEEVLFGDPSPIAITNQPQNAIVPERGTAIFSVGAMGSPQGIQWYRSDDGGLNYNAIPGAFDTSYTIPSVAIADHGARFFALLTNLISFATSSVVNLSVIADTAPPVAIRAVGDLDPTKVHLTFSEPLDEANIDESNFEVFITGTVPNGSFPTFAATLINGTNVQLITESRQPGENYSVKILDVRDASSGSNPMEPNPTTVPIRPTIQLIGFDTDNEWKYFIGSDIFGTGWETTSYDDSTWPSGPSGLGLDSSFNAVPIRTTISYTGMSEPSWYRKHFVLPASTNGLVLTLRDVVEDGAVYFINGKEVFRHNVSPGALSYTTRAATQQPEPAQIRGPFNLAITNVMSGDNVMAVVVVQSGATSVDVELAVELTATFHEFFHGDPCLAIVQQPQSQTIIEGQSVMLSVYAEGSLPINFQWYKNGSILAGRTNSSYVINSATPIDSGIYQVSVSNSACVLTSAVAVVTAECDCTSPVFQSALGSTNLTNIILTITDNLGLDQASVENIAHYDIHLTAGGGNLTILSAVLTNGTNVVLTTSPRIPGAGYTVALNNITDRSLAQNPVTPSSRALSVAMVILAPNDMTLWRYNSASNNLDGINWQMPGYDDSTWLTGLAGFTTSNSLEITTNGFELRTTNMLAPVAGGPVTTYYRVNFNLPFNFPCTAPDAALQLVGVVDDGLVAYINGVEAGRLRVTNASPVSFTNLASAPGPESADAHSLDVLTLTNLSSLAVGNNLLAIELHQNSATSPDAVLAIQLLVQFTSLLSSPPSLRISREAADGKVTLAWAGCAGAFVLQETDMLNPGVRWTDDPLNPTVNTIWTNVLGNPTSPYTFIPSGGQKFYRVKGY